jgi:two-component system chemotaxis sensor kinase CheA
MERSRKIRRQLRKAFDTEDIGLLARMGSGPATGVLLSGVEQFLDQVDAAYAQGDDKLRLAVRNLQLSSGELTEANRKLESLNAAMHTMLEGLGQGLLMFGRDGRCFDTYSRACLTLFGAPPAGRPIADVLDLPADTWPQFQAVIDLAYRDGCAMPFDDIMAMAPRRIGRAGDPHLEISYRPIRDHAGQLVSILVIATDRTAEEEAAREFRRNQEKVRRILAIARDRDDFLRLTAEIRSSLLDRLAGPPPDAADLADLRRTLHTLKGSAMSFHLEDLGEALAALETSIRQVASPCVPALFRLHLDSIEAALSRTMDEARPVFANTSGDPGGNRVIPADALRSFHGRLCEQTPALAREFEGLFMSQHIHDVLKPLRTSLLALAERAGKVIDSVTIEGEDFPIPSEGFDRLCRSLVNIARNIVDHAIEPPELRSRSGKPPGAGIRVETRLVTLDGASWCRIAIEDDGAGLDLAALRGRAGVPVELSDDEVAQCVFTDGLSTASSDLLFSGVGLGMGAVRAEAEKLGGTATISSRPGWGTTTVITVPLGR